MDPYNNNPLDPISVLVVVRRAPRLVLPANETPRTILHLPVMNTYVGFGSILSSHVLLFEAHHHHSLSTYPSHEAGGEVMRNPSHALVRGLEKVLSSYYPFAGRLRSSSSSETADRGGQLELVCHGQGAVFVEAQANVSLAELKKLDKVYWSDLQYDSLGETSTEIAPLVIQVTALTCGGFVLSVRVLHSLCDGAGILHFLHAWSEFTKSTQNVPITIPIWGGMVPLQLAHWPQKFHFPSLELIHGPEEYAHVDDHKLHYMETRDQPYYDNVHGLSNQQHKLQYMDKRDQPPYDNVHGLSPENKLQYMDTRDQPHYENVHGLSHGHKLHYMDKRNQPYYDDVYGLSNISISLKDLSNLKYGIRVTCNRFEALAALFWRERTRAMALPQSSEVFLFFPAPLAHDVHLAFYGQYGFNCAVSARAGDLIQSELDDVVRKIQEAKALVEENFIECMRKFVQLHCPAKRAPPHVLLFTVLWDGMDDIDFGTGSAPYAPDATRSHSLVNVAAITGGLEDTIEIVMTNAPLTLADKISFHLLPSRPRL